MERDRRSRLPWAIVLLVTALSCLTAFAGTRIYAAVTQSDSFASYRILQLDTMQKISAVDDGFVYYDGSAVTKVGADGGTKWSSLVGSGADFYATEDGVAAWIGSRLTIIENRSGTPSFTGTMEADVISARVGSQYAAVLLGPEHNSTIVLMETGGRLVDSITLSDQTVIDYGFFYNDTLFWVMVLDTNGTVPSCTVNTYRPGRRMVGSISDSEQVFYHASFQSAQISCVGDTFVKVFNYNGTEQKDLRTLVYGWTLADADDDSDQPLMAFTANGQYDADAEIRDVRMIRGSSDQIVRMPFGCTSLKAWNNRVYGFSSEGYVMVAELGKQKVNAYQLGLHFDTVYGVADGGVAILGFGNTVYLVTMA